MNGVWLKVKQCILILNASKIFSIHKKLLFKITFQNLQQVPNTAGKLYLWKLTENAVQPFMDQKRLKPFQKRTFLNSFRWDSNI